MSERRVRLTRKIVEAAQPGVHELKIWDSEVSGFGVRRGGWRCPV
jgi:hypothetical protein